MKPQRCWLGFLVAALSALGQPTERQMVLDAMKERPADPWPRGTGHVVLALPGSREEDKAYHEPGGSFSPGFATFGVSLWVVGVRGQLIATSDSIPLGDLHQQLVWPDPKQIPAIKTDTDFYSATWSSGGLGKWRLDLALKQTNNLVLVVRSVGPAGAPLRSLDWDGKRLSVNERWTITASAKIAQVQVGAESAGESTRAAKPAQRWRSDQGWGFARLALTESRLWRITVSDTAPSPAPALRYAAVRSGIDFRLPDNQFVDSLQAQVAHLMMGLVRNETRPGEPNNYPLNWLRDGAYVIVALARAGQMEVAKQLCQPFAEQDFFGGFGTEADAPGLALWALGEVSALARDPAFDRYLWPHATRKTALVEEMLGAAQTLRKPFSGQIVPIHREKKDLDLLCEPANEGLIQGKMDWHRPVLYVNAASYRGLLATAGVAERLAESSEAQRLRAKAAELRKAWNRGLASPTHENERNYICGLYPAYVVSDLNLFRNRIEDFWRRTHDARDRVKNAPLWTYFNVAAAHQWLMLDQPERTWAEVRWFWNHQASPGLYTWWEGSGEENNFGRWERLARGWVQPAHVTPHYWTAAEMLLLQLDMLGYVDESGREPALIIGAGVPSTWLDHPLQVKGLGTSLGRVDWEWRNRKLTVVVHGERCRVGPAGPFAADVPIESRFEP